MKKERERGGKCVAFLKKKKCLLCAESVCVSVCELMDDKKKKVEGGKVGMEAQ